MAVGCLSAEASMVVRAPGLPPASGMGNLNSFVPVRTGGGANRENLL